MHVELFFLQAITFSLGESVVNVYDNIVSEEDEILLYVEGYMSIYGSGRSNQVSIYFSITKTILLCIYGRQMLVETFECASR